MDLISMRSRTASQEEFLRKLDQVKADKFSLPADLMDKLDLINLDSKKPVSRQLSYLQPFFYAHKQKSKVIFERRLQNKKLKQKFPYSLVGVCEKCGRKFAYGAGEGECQSRFRNSNTIKNDSVLLCDECRKKEYLELYDGNTYSLRYFESAKKKKKNRRIKVAATAVTDLF